LRSGHRSSRFRIINFP